MQLDKYQFTLILKVWLEHYLKAIYSNEYNIEVTIPESNLSKLAIDSLKLVPNYSSFEFNPDVLAILTPKKGGKPELVLLNRTINAISLKEIGELLCYSRISNPLLSFIVSSKGLPHEVSLLLLNKEREEQLLSYSASRKIAILKWNETTNKMDTTSIFPLEKRGEF